MRYTLFIILACFSLVVTAAALPLTPKMITTISITNLADISCSADTFPDSPNASIIWVTYESGMGDTYIDNVGRMPMWAKTLGGNPGWQFPVSAGVHTVRISRSGYNTYTANVQVCNGKVSYVNYNQASFVPTTATTTVTTTVPTTTVSVVPVTTTLTGETTPAQTMTGTSAPQETLGSLSVTTTPAGAFIFIDGVQRGVSPATIPGLSAGTHTVLLKTDGYQDLSTPVTIAAGKTQDYSTSLSPAVSATATTTPATTGQKKGITSGFEAACGIATLGALMLMRKMNP